MTNILILGEAWGKDEEESRTPFVGTSGRFLNAMLAQVGIRREDCFVTNVFNLRPPGNDVEALCGKRHEGIPGMPHIRQGKYIRAEFAPELARLYTEIKTVAPNIIIALGGTAVWALTGIAGIKKVRGAPIESRWPMPGIKILPTYHPSAVLRDMSLRVVLFADLKKAAAEAHFPEIRRPVREFWIEPSLADMERFEAEHIVPSPFLSIDIETKGNQITCIGFATATDVALVVPFYSRSSVDGNYWASFEEERSAWDLVRKWCRLRKVILGQNHLYDAGFLLRQYGITMPHMQEDTMLMHHAMQPEMEKGLGFLGTIYTDEPQWKFMREDVKTVKKED